MPILQLWSEKYAKQGLRVMGVTEMSTDAKIIRKALEEVGVTYPAVTDFGEKISKRYKIKSHPTTYIVDRQGVIRHVEEGFVKGDEVPMQKLVEKLLAEKVNSQVTNAGNAPGLKHAKMPHQKRVQG